MRTTSKARDGVNDPVFDKQSLNDAFSRLAQHLKVRGVTARVMVFGGAAMIMAYESDVITRDVDSLFSPDGPVLDAVRQVAIEMGWPSSWLNNQASVYVSASPGTGPAVFDHPNLHVSASPADHLLAMKVIAARAARDREDIERLVAHLGISRRREVWEIVSRFFPQHNVSQRSRLLVEDLLPE